jgi:TRL-like protein family
MRKSLANLWIATSLLGLSGCMIVQSPVMGILGGEVTWGDVATGKTAARKEGRACMDTILGLVARGDASVRAAKESAGITEVSVVDHSARNFLGIRGQYCTIVRGN